MQSLLEIEGIDPPLAELFEAAGFLSVDIFAANSAETIHTELVQANSMLNLVVELPSVECIELWKNQTAVPLVSSPASESPKKSPLGGGNQSGRYAIPISSGFLELNKIDVDSLPQIQAIESMPSAVTAKEGKGLVEHRPAKKVVDRSRVRSLDEFRTNGSEVAPLERRSDDSNVRAPKDSTNAGVDPNSKSYVRGVLHSDGERTYWGAIAFLVTLLLLVLSVLPIIYVVVKRDQFAWGVLSLGLLIVAFFVYVLAARKSSCPVCRQRQFVPKACNKHVKAHSVPMLGNMIPTALHLIRYKWFRCIFCGTAIRVKE